MENADGIPEGVQEAKKLCQSLNEIDSLKGEITKLKEELASKTWHIKKSGTEFEKLLSDQEAVILKYRNKNNKLLSLYKTYQKQCESLTKELQEVKSRNQLCTASDQSTISSTNVENLSNNYTLVGGITKLLDVRVCKKVREFIEEFKLQRKEIAELKKEIQRLKTEQRSKDDKNTYILETAKKRIISYEKLIQSLRDQNASAEKKSSERESEYKKKISELSEEKTEMGHKIEVLTQEVRTSKLQLKSSQSNKIDVLVDQGMTTSVKSNGVSNLNNAVDLIPTQSNLTKNELDFYDPDLKSKESIVQTTQLKSDLFSNLDWVNDVVNHNGNVDWKTTTLSQICRICAATFSSKKDLFIHLGQQHNKGVYQSKQNNFKKQY